MKNILLLIPLFWTLLACGGNPYSTKQYFSDAERDTLLTNIITFISAKAPNATNSNRFEPQFKAYYQKALPQYTIESISKTADGTTYYFFLIRPVGSSPNVRRGVLGKFKLAEGSLMPTNFEEIVNTPHLDEATVKERGGFLFKELLKNGSLDKYLSMKHYIEWPDSMLVYDKKINEWVSTGHGY
jgi:hypothetical protein